MALVEPSSLLTNDTWDSIYVQDELFWALREFVSSRGFHSQGFLSFFAKIIKWAGIF